MRRGLRHLRLHGRPAWHYRRRGPDADLGLLESAPSGARPGRVLFNDDALATDAALRCP